MERAQATCCLRARAKRYSGKAQFLGLVPGTNSRGALSAGLNGASVADGTKGVYVMIGDDTVDGALLAQLEDADFVVAQGCYRDALAEQADVVLPDHHLGRKVGHADQHRRPYLGHASRPQTADERQGRRRHLDRAGGKARIAKNSVQHGDGPRPRQLRLAPVSRPHRRHN